MSAGTQKTGFTMDDILSNINNTVKCDVVKPPRAPSVSEPSKGKRKHEETEVSKVVKKKSKKGHKAEDRSRGKKPIELEDIGVNVIMDESVQDVRTKDFALALDKVADVFYTVDEDCKETLKLYHAPRKKYEAEMKRSEGLVKTLNEVTAKVDRLKEDAVMLKNSLAASQGEVNSIKKSTSKLEVKLRTMEQNQDAEIATMRNAFINDACKNFLQCRITMMEKFQDGSYVEWDLEEARKTLATYQNKIVEEAEVNSGAYAHLVKDIAKDIAGTAREGTTKDDNAEMEKDVVQGESREASSAA